MFIIFNTIVAAISIIIAMWYANIAHSPDNSFMGFVVDHYLDSVNTDVMKAKKDQAVVYGKAEYMWQVGQCQLLFLCSRLFSD